MPFAVTDDQVILGSEAQWVFWIINLLIWTCVVVSTGSKQTPENGTIESRKGEPFVFFNGGPVSEVIVDYLPGEYEGHASWHIDDVGDSYLDMTLVNRGAPFVQGWVGLKQRKTQAGMKRPHSKSPATYEIPILRVSPEIHCETVPGGPRR